MQLRLAVLILAAGASERYKNNKLLSLHPAGSILINYVINTCLPLCSFKAPVVVSGRWHQSLSQVVSPTVNLIYNADWQHGMGTSIACGVNHLVSDTEPGKGDVEQPTHILVVLGDMPVITTESVGALVEAMHRNPENVIVSAWHQRHTVPAVFPAEYFSELQSLASDEGARGLIKRLLTKQPQKVTSVAHEQAAVDIDTPEDWNRLYTR